VIHEELHKQHGKIVRIGMNWKFLLIADDSSPKKNSTQLFIRE
jgi:hypothetical protein